MPSKQEKICLFTIQQVNLDISPPKINIIIIIGLVLMKLNILLKPMYI